MSNIEEYTKNFKFIIPEFNIATWHTEIKENFKAIDALIANFVQSQQYKGAWKQVTQYYVGDLVYISDKDSNNYGGLFKVLVNHITTGDDFDTFLGNNPTYYNLQGEMGAQVAALRAQDWAEKTDGIVTINESPVDYSSKAYAIGGTGTETNNSKYFKEQAELARDGILLNPGFIAIKNDLLGDENIKTVAENISNINAVNANKTNINAVNANKTNIDAVVSNQTNINNVANNASNINSVADNATNINAVAGNISDVNNCATNINAILDAPTQATNAQNSATSAAQSAQLAQEAALSITSFDLFDHKWSDHLLNDQNWLRADTFSWQDGTVYSDAYQHLVDDVNGSSMTYYAWETSAVVAYDTVFSLSESPSAGENIYVDDNGTMSLIGTITSFDGTNLIVNGTTYTRNSSKDEEVLASQTETVGSYTITYVLAADGHKITTDETTVANIYSESGVAWYYILDTANQRFKLPRENPAREELVETVPVVGNGTALGLLADTGVGGTLRYLFQDNLPKFGFSQVGSNVPVGTAATSWNTNNSFFNKAVGVTTNENNSGIIAKFSGETTKSVFKGHKYLYFYVGQFSQTATEQTAGLNSELFNGKMDLDLGNVPTTSKETIVGWGMPDYTAGISLNYTTVNTNFPINGIAYFGYKASTNTSANIYINDQEFGLGGSSATNNSTQTAYRVSTDDVYRFQTVSYGQFGIIYPLKGEQNA